jgi:hypothetical protein
MVELLFWRRCTKQQPNQVHGRGCVEAAAQAELRWEQRQHQKARKTSVRNSSSSSNRKSTSK